jgi:rhodanese-related sulfurtransferase
MSRLLSEILAVLSVATGLGLAVNAFSPRGIAVTRPLPLHELDARYITTDEAKARFDAGRAIFVDARKPEEFARGHVFGALNLPLETFPASYARKAAVLPREVEIVVYCGGIDCAESRELANRLQQVGYSRDRLKVFRGGWTEWKARGWPAE